MVSVPFINLPKILKPIHPCQLASPSIHLSIYSGRCPLPTPFVGHVCGKSPNSGKHYLFSSLFLPIFSSPRPLISKPLLLTNPALAVGPTRPVPVPVPIIPVPVAVGLPPTPPPAGTVTVTVTCVVVVTVVGSAHVVPASEGPLP